MGLSSSRVIASGGINCAASSVYFPRSGAGWPEFRVQSNTAWRVSSLPLLMSCVSTIVELDRRSIVSRGIDNRSLLDKEREDGDYHATGPVVATRFNLVINSELMPALSPTTLLGRNLPHRWTFHFDLAAVVSRA